MTRLLLLLLSLTLAVGDCERAAAEIRLQGAIASAARVALAIGNAHYRDAGTLPTPENDATALAAALTRIGFEVDLETDLDLSGMQHALRDFGLKAEAADIALVFYAGHAVQVAGENYLLPVDAVLQHERDLDFEAVPLELMIDQMAHARELGLVILDANRDNPLAEDLRRALGPSRAQLVGDGLARVENLPRGTMIAFAARPGEVAPDGSGEHSPYAAALLEHIEEPGVEINFLFRKVRHTVLVDTGRRQEPRAYGALGAQQFHLVERAPNRAPVVEAPSPVPMPAIPLDISPPVDPVTITVVEVPATGTIRDGERIVEVGDELSAEALAGLVLDPGDEGASGSFAIKTIDTRGVSATSAMRVDVPAFAAEPAPAHRPGGGIRLHVETAEVALSSRPAPPESFEAATGSNIRRGPSVDTEVLWTIAAGTPLRVVGRVPGRNWYEVETEDGRHGFIYGDLIRTRPAPKPALAQSAEPATLSSTGSRSGLVRVFYGTDRVNAGTATVPRFDGERARQLSLGTVVVRIPPEHELGRVERPWSFSILGRDIYAEQEDPARHFTIHRIEITDRDRFIDDLRQVVSVSRSYERQAFVFIHGYNVGFEAAAFRTAQIAHDLNFDGAPILYSWPSRGDLIDYEYDQNSASQARPRLKEFLELVRSRSGAGVIHLIAHSMGSGPLLEVLAELKGEQPDAATPLFNEIVLAAPDIDVDVFHYLAKRVRGVGQGMTMYVSSADRAMQAARTYARGVPRAGDVPHDGPVIDPGIETIDATALGTGFFGLNHSDYAENRILLNDIGLLLRAGLHPPDERNLTLVRVPHSDGHYWKYPE